MKNEPAKFDAEELNLITLAQEYSDNDKARELLETMLWPDGPICPHCKNDTKTYSMKNHYAKLAGYANSQYKHRLATSINVSQRGNESKFGPDLSKYPVSMEKVDRNAEFIGESLKLPQ